MDVSEPRGRLVPVPEDAEDADLTIGGDFNLDDHIAGLQEGEEVSFTVDFGGPSAPRAKCPYAACPACDGCGVCMNFHGNFVGRCGDGDCPYRWYHKIRDRIRRWLR